MNQNKTVFTFFVFPFSLVMSHTSSRTEACTRSETIISEWLVNAICMSCREKHMSDAVQYVIVASIFSPFNVRFDARSQLHCRHSDLSPQKTWISTAINVPECHTPVSSKPDISFLPGSLNNIALVRAHQQHITEADSSGSVQDIYQSLCFRSLRCASQHQQRLCSIAIVYWLVRVQKIFLA